MLFLCLLLAGWGSAFSNGNLQNGDVETNEKDLKAIDDVKNKRDHCAFRALELSLYYQGFDPDKNLYYLDEIYDDVITTVPFNSELVGTRKIRDAKKAFEYAKIAYELLTRESISSLDEHEGGAYMGSMFVANLASLYISGIGVEQDLTKKNVLIRYNKLLSWRNYYIGKFAPLDKKYAISLLENGIISIFEYLPYEKPKKEYSSYILYLIYNGEFDPNNKDLEKAKYWKNIHDKIISELREHEIKRWNEGIEKLRKEASVETEEGRKAYRVLGQAHLQKRKYIGVIYNRRRYVENSNYNPELARKFLEKSGADEESIITIFVKKLSNPVTGDLSEMKKYLKEVLSSPALSDDFKEKLTKEASLLEDRYIKYYGDAFNLEE